MRTEVCKATMPKRSRKLLENENQWQRLNSCKEEFRNYIYDDEGSFLIGGEDVYNFIRKANNLIYN